MQIIKRGTIPGERIWVGECGHCGSVAEAKQSELTCIKTERDGSFSWEVCPVCNTGGKINGENYGGMCFHPKNERR